MILGVTAITMTPHSNDPQMTAQPAAAPAAALVDGPHQLLVDHLLGGPSHRAYMGLGIVLMSMIAAKTSSTTTMRLRRRLQLQPHTVPPVQAKKRGLVCFS